MKIRVLQYDMKTPAGQPECGQWEAIRAQDMEQVLKGAPALFLVPQEALKELASFKDFVVDRGKKNSHKGLSGYFLGTGKKNKLLIIDGGFEVATQVNRSMLALLSKAATLGDLNVYAVGVEEAVFDDLWKRALETGSAQGKQKTGRTFPYPSPEEDLDELCSRHLSELLARCQVPPEFKDTFVGDSWQAYYVRALAMLASQNDEPVMILGDTGTGKEVVARAIHNYSRRKGGPFLPVNCGAIPPALFEEELFGHERGVFTDAKDRRTGLWAAADKGTLFLDEMGDLPPGQQVKILRALESGKVRRVGGTRDETFDVRIIVATNRDLFSMVQAGEFREDLYYRLRGVLIRTTALRIHAEDIALIAQHLWKKINKQSQGKLSEDIIRELQNYTWPGNVRELKAVLNNLRSHFGTEYLSAGHLRTIFYLAGLGRTSNDRPVSEKDIGLHRAKCLSHLRRVDEVLRALERAAAPVAKNQKLTVKQAEATERPLRLRLNELEILCREPLLFHRKATSDAVWRILGSLTYFLGLLKKDLQEAGKCWTGTLRQEMKNILSVVFREIEKILEKG